MTDEKLIELIERATNDAWDKNDLLPNIQARLFCEIKQALCKQTVIGSCCEITTKKRGFIYVDEECGNKSKISF